MSAIHGVNYGRPTLDLNFAKNKSLIDTVSGLNLVTFTRSQTAREATYVGADGLIKTAVANEPRFDHNPVTGVCNGLLIEESRTNLRTLSTDFSSGWGFNANVTVVSGQTSPTGDSTASLVTINAGNFISRIGEKFFFGGTVYTRSLFVKKTNQRYIWCGDQNNGGYSPNYRFDLDLGIGVVFSDTSGNNRGYSITAFGNGYFRISVSCTSFDIFSWTANNNASFNPLISNSGSAVHDGTESFIAWGYQIEQDTFPTSYIPTTGSTVTRSADVASITGTNFSRWYNSSEGTWFGSIPTLSGSSGRLVEVTGPGGADYSMSIRPRASSSRVDFARFNSGTPQVNITFPAKIAANYNSASIQGAANGTLAGLLTTGSHSNSTSVDIGRISSENTYLGGTINRLTYWPSRLQNSQLQQLTK
jgi:hypothetical protein